MILDLREIINLNIFVGIRKLLDKILRFLSKLKLFYRAVSLI